MVAENQILCHHYCLLWENMNQLQAAIHFIAVANEECNNLAQLAWGWCPFPKCCSHVYMLRMFACAWLCSTEPSATSQYYSQLNFFPLVRSCSYQRAFCHLCTKSLLSASTGILQEAQMHHNAAHADSSIAIRAMSSSATPACSKGYKS